MHIHVSCRVFGYKQQKQLYFKKEKLNFISVPTLIIVDNRESWKNNASLEIQKSERTKITLYK